MPVNNPADLLVMEDENLAQLYEESRQLMNEYAEQSKAIREELLARAKERGTVDDWIAGEFSISCQTIVRFKTTAKQAKELGAVQTVEKADTKKLRSLYDAGVEVPGVNVTEDVRIRRIEE